ncbi:MAG: hypothetical protein MJZ41_09570 [Bacteroidaceae bacterium]|nr:hypothetical protein [Bacteroidaceae bacterium]
MGQYAELALAQKERMLSIASMRHVKGRADDGFDYDDKDAGGGDYETYWSIQPPSNWKDNLRIDLLPEEADILHRHISQNTKGSLLQLYLDNYAEAEKANGFPDLVVILSKYMDKQSIELANMAINFDRLTYMAKVRFNIMLTNNNDESLIDEWESLLNEYRSNPFDLDIDNLFVKLKISSGGDWGLKSFLKSLQSMIKEGDNGFAKLDELIRKREKGIKGAASKLGNVNGYSVNDRAGYDHYDYRFFSARRIVRDIVTVEKR